jgi:ribosomal protein L40E
MTSASQRPTTDADDMLCPRCGARAESGFVLSARSSRWSSERPRWLSYARGDEKLAPVAGKLAGFAVTARRCRQCHLVWFEA